MMVYAVDDDEFVYHYPNENGKPYYQMSMYAYKLNSTDEASYPTGVFRLLDTQNNNAVSYAYCADSAIYDAFGSYYKIVPLTECDTTKTSANKLRAVINHSYPFVPQEEMIQAIETGGVTLHDDTIPCYEMVLITAVQQTIYSFTNPETTIGVPFAGAVPREDYEQYYKDYIYDFENAYENGVVQAAYSEIGKDISAVINWLKGLEGETAPALPTVFFKGVIAVEGGKYVLTLSGFSNELEAASSLKATVSVGGTPVLTDSPITLDQNGESRIILPDTALSSGAAVSVTVTGTQTYQDAVAYEARAEDASQNFIGQQTLTRALTHTVENIAVPDAVTIRPADLTIYMGGEDGYGTVVDGSGQTTDTTALPRPLFYVTAPAGVDTAKLIFSSTDSVPGAEGTYKQWSLETAGADRNRTPLYYLNKVHEVQDEVRVQYAIGDQAYVSDQFNPSEVQDLFEDYTISLYTGTVNPAAVTASVEGGSTTYGVVTGTGTLRVRAVENGEHTPEDNPVYSVQAQAPQNALPSGTAAVVAPAGTRYTLNHTTVDVLAAGVGLLFDDIYDKDNGTNQRENALIARTDQQLGPVGEGWTRYYQAKYLDLVDADNGNAWVKTVDQPVTVYWAYPEGTDSSTAFRLLHFENLHRDDADNANSGYSTVDISNTTPTEVAISKTSAGISFSVPSGGFSPFVLVWEKSDTGGTTPPPSGGDDSDRVGKLQISKTVTGEGDENKSFTFTVLLTNSSGNQLGSRFSYSGSKQGTIKSGESITLRDGESVTISGIPAGCSYTVTETPAEGYTTEATGDSGKILNGKTAIAAFVNDWTTTPPDETEPPDQPDEPDIPDTPDTPDPSDTPDTPDQPDAPSDPGTPQTGDNSLIGLWALLCMVSLIGLCLTAVGGRFRSGKHSR